MLISSLYLTVFEIKGMNIMCIITTEIKIKIYLLFIFGISYTNAEYMTTDSIKLFTMITACTNIYKYLKGILLYN